MSIRIAGTGSYVPERILSNADLEKMVETNDEWIRTRTGIEERRIASPEQATSDLAALMSKYLVKPWTCKIGSAVNALSSFFIDSLCILYFQPALHIMLGTDLLDGRNIVHTFRLGPIAAGCKSAAFRKIAGRRHCPRNGEKLPFFRG